MKPKKSEAVADSTNGDETQKLDHQENSLNDSRGDNVAEELLDETNNSGKENAEEQSVSAVNGLCDDKKKKKKKKKTHKQEEQEHVLPITDSSGYQSDHKKSKKRKRKHCSEVEESELSQLSQEPKAKTAKKERDYSLKCLS